MTDNNDAGHGHSIGEAMVAYSRQRLDSPHPSSDTLTAYYEERLAGSEMTEVRRHVVHCSDCTAFLVDLDDFLRPAGDGEEVPPQSRPLVSGQLRNIEQGRGKTVKSESAERRLLGWRIAASVLFATTIGLAIVTALLFNDRSSPRGDVFVLADLRPEGLTRQTAQVRRVPPWAREVLVFLNVPEQRVHESYMAVLRNAEGDTLWRGEVLPGEHGSLSLLIPLNILSQDDHIIRLYGISEPEGEDLLSTYRLNLHPP